MARRPVDPERLWNPYIAQGKPCSLSEADIETIARRIEEAEDWAPFERKIAEIYEMGAALALDPEVSGREPCPY